MIKAFRLTLVLTFFFRVGILEVEEVPGMAATLDFDLEPRAGSSATEEDSRRLEASEID